MFHSVKKDIVNLTEIIQIWRSCKPFAYMQEIGNLITSLIQVVTAPRPNARQQAWLSRVFEVDHYKGLARVTVGVAR